MTTRRPISSEDLASLRSAQEGLELVSKLLDETTKRYLARLHEELDDIRATLAEAEQSAMSAARRRRLSQLLEMLSQVEFHPEKGRRKELKKIDELIGELQDVLGQW
ncbi:hypothetical protein DB346_20580 [Verrucomicrobia bacterium LW23]|nr:hypothetical protein DB346_20580 [Verrucomicrobia bacterium LW23]